MYDSVRQVIKTEGMQRVEMQVAGVKRELNFVQMPVHGPLASMLQLVDKGHTVLIRRGATLAAATRWSIYAGRLGGFAIFSHMAAGIGVRPVLLAIGVEDGYEDDERTAAIPSAAHMLLSAEEIAAHENTHLPYRAWCFACVRGRGVALRHERVDHRR
eukprot:6092323-Amphidinium_carterae.1